MPVALNISPLQLEKLNRERDCEFVDGIAQYLVGRFHLYQRLGFKYESLAKEIKPLITQAIGLGLPRYDGLALHVLASFILGVDYHETPVVKPILHSKELSGDLKVVWLDRWIHSLEDAAVKQTGR